MQKIDLEKLAKQLPGVDGDKLDESRRVHRTLRKAGVRGAVYRPASPAERKPVQIIDTASERHAINLAKQD